MPHELNVTLYSSKIVLDTMILKFILNKRRVLLITIVIDLEHLLMI
jgi:hypothetical protein